MNVDYELEQKFKEESKPCVYCVGTSLESRHRGFIQATHDDLREFCFERPKSEIKRILKHFNEFMEIPCIECNEDFFWCEDNVLEDN